MKVKIKKTGEICNIASWAKVTLEFCDSYGNPIELDFDEVEFCVEPSINWEQRRYEITKAALQGFLTHDSPFEYDVEYAIQVANNAISRLKELNELKE